MVWQRPSQQECEASFHSSCVPVTKDQTGVVGLQMPTLPDGTTGLTDSFHHQQHHGTMEAQNFHPFQHNPHQNNFLLLQRNSCLKEKLKFCCRKHLKSKKLTCALRMTGDIRSLQIVFKISNPGDLQKCYYQPGDTGREGKIYQPGSLLKKKQLPHLINDKNH